MSTSDVIVVSGGTGGLGRAVTRAFLNGGATVVTTYRSQTEFDELAGTLDSGDAGQRARLVGRRVDVTDPASALELVTDVVARYGTLHALVNAAGGYSGGQQLWETGADVLDRMLALNLKSGYALAHAVVPAMLKQGRGSIVNVAAKAGVDHPAGAAAYAASKAAALALMNSLAAELKGTGVRVNSVMPSIIDTEANRKAIRTPTLPSGQSPTTSPASLSFFAATTLDSFTALRYPSTGTADTSHCRRLRAAQRAMNSALHP